MDITTLSLLGRLLFDVVKWVTHEIQDAELSRELPPDKKHEYVRQNILHRINNYEIDNGIKATGRADFSKLPLQAIANAKNEAIKHIDRTIKREVELKHATGEFVR